MVAERFLQGLDAEVRRQRDRQPPAQDLPAEPVDDGGQVDETARHRDVGDVHGPDLIGRVTARFRKQIGIDLVPRRRLRRVRTAVDRGDPHPPHQRRDMTPAHLMAFAVQKPFQHPAARERILQMQLVDPAHQCEIGVRNRARQVIDAAPADPERLGLTAEAQPMVAIDHRFALGRRPALPSATAKKSFSSVSSPIFACRVFTSTAGAASPGGRVPEHARCALQKLRAPLRDLVRVHVELLGQLSQRLLASDGRQCDLRFEGRAVVPPWSSGHGSLLALGNHADNARIIHSSPLSRFPEPPLWSCRHTAPIRTPSSRCSRNSSTCCATPPSGPSRPWRRTGALPDRFTPHECSNYLVNAGYASS